MSNDKKKRKEMVVEVDGNLISIKKKPDFFETVFKTSQHCRNEITYYQAEKKRFNSVLRQLGKCDPRGMWIPELGKVEKDLNEFIETLDWTIKNLQKRALKLFQEGK